MIQLLMLTKKGIISFLSSQCSLNTFRYIYPVFRLLEICPYGMGLHSQVSPWWILTSFDFRLDVEDNASIRNSVFVVKDWGNANVKIRVGDVDFGDFKRGKAKCLDGVGLVLWLNLKVDHSVSLSILPLEGQTLNIRTSPPGPYRCDIPVFPEGSSEPGPFGGFIIPT